MKHAGGLLDYNSVREGLRNGQIGHLGLDVQWVEPMDPQDWIAQHPRCWQIRSLRLSLLHESDAVFLLICGMLHAMTRPVKCSADGHSNRGPEWTALLAVRAVARCCCGCFAAEALTGSVLCRVVLTPHVAGVTELSYRRMAEIVAGEARRMRDGLPPTILLNGVSPPQEVAGAQNQITAA